jgi:hypothetical protein
MDFKQNANKHELKQILLFLQYLGRRPLGVGQFTAMITLKMWRTGLPT